MSQPTKIHGINGPVITVLGEGFFMAETVLAAGLPGEVISLKPGEATIQVYESTSGLKPGMPVEKTNRPMSVTLRPGIIGGIFDGVGNPLSKRADIDPPDINLAENFNWCRNIWAVKVTAKVGQILQEGEVFATVSETENITYKAMVPPGVSGEVMRVVADGEYHISDEILAIKTPEGEQILTLTQQWPIRVPRPIKHKRACEIPLITGQRVIDSLFPIAKGGTCSIPGGFGTGKTMTQHQIARHCDAEVIIYIGCGERGNEMTEVLESFGTLLSRTVLIANTSDMPVAAREASIYTGITLAECYRDMGYHVAVMADSTSRWAEALRELAARLEEIPAEEGYPAYLATRLAEFYSRAGFSENLNGTTGSITIIGAVSPQGSDFSEPVTMHTKRFTRCFWALDRRLAYARHFPAINWNESYSGYLPALDPWFAKNVHKDFAKYRTKILKILHDETVLLETVKLVGEDALSEEERHTLSVAETIRKNFIAQNARNPEDTYTPLEKQFEMMREATNA
ncbi:MAG: V-type ATP synthase subunit A [Defluviitaleaceae bacterium]|nr:V-type ATP synthase subunit A [Defluviitaleaceae bacterium]